MKSSTILAQSKPLAFPCRREEYTTPTGGGLLERAQPIVAPGILLAEDRETLVCAALDRRFPLQQIDDDHKTDGAAQSDKRVCPDVCEESHEIHGHG